MPQTTSLHIGRNQEQPLQIIPQKKQKIHLSTLFQDLNAWVIEKSPLKTKEKVAFFRLLATMINAGVSLLKALNILADQTRDAKMKKMCWDMANKVEIGQTLSEGMEDFPSVFTTSEVGMTRSGEASGRLNEVLTSLADKVEKDTKMKGKIKGAMAYPVAIMIVIVLVFVAVTVLVIPKMKETFESAGADLPKSTQMLIAASDFFKGGTLGVPNPILLVASLVLLYVLLRLWRKTPNGKLYWDSLMLRIPVFGALRRKLILAQLSRSVATLTKSGISIVKTLEITSEVLGNEVYRRRILLTADDVKQGITIAENLRGNTKIFPVMLVSMIAIGEQTAQLSNVTGKVADFYEDEVDTMVKTLASLMEPFIIVVIGVLVGFMVTAIMTPIMRMSEVATG